MCPCKEKHIWFFQLSTQNQLFKNRLLSGRRLWTWYLSSTGSVSCQWIQGPRVYLFQKLLVPFKMRQLAFTVSSLRTTALRIHMLSSPWSGFISAAQNTVVAECWILSEGELASPMPKALGWRNMSHRERPKMEGEVSYLSVAPSEGIKSEAILVTTITTAVWQQWCQTGQTSLAEHSAPSRRWH